MFKSIRLLKPWKGIYCLTFFVGSGYISFCNVYKEYYFVGEVDDENKKVTT